MIRYSRSSARAASGTGVPRKRHMAVCPLRTYGSCLLALKMKKHLWSIRYSRIAIEYTVPGTPAVPGTPVPGTRFVVSQIGVIAWPYSIFYGNPRIKSKANSFNSLSRSPVRREKGAGGKKGPGKRKKGARLNYETQEQTNLRLKSEGVKRSEPFSGKHRETGEGYGQIEFVS
jgi:hypothetical protein